MADYLITGAAGFIGFHTARKLKNGIGIDNFNDYYDPQLKRDRAAILKKEGFEVIEGDINDKALLERLIVEHRPKAIIHLAAQAGVRYSLQNPMSYLKSNIDGFLTILELVRQHPSIKLVYASSSSVYGRNEKTPYSVLDRTDKQASLYGVTKKTNELMADAYHHLFGINVCGLRFFTVYGPWGRPDMAYFTFSDAIRKGKEIELYNFGECVRDFTYIDDIVDGIIASMEVEGSNVFNLGNHEPVKLTEFVNTLEKLWDKKAKISLKPLQKGDVIKTFADIEESRKRIGFSPKTSLEEGLKKYVDWHKDYFKNIH